MRIEFALAAMAVCMNGAATEYFVATNGCDGADGSAARPWRTIQRAADVVVAGDTVTIRGGVYREWVNPVNVGHADAPITYRAAKGEKVVVTGADPARGWAGIWLDWMAQGARVSCNTLWCNPRDLFLEVNHGPILVEGNDCLSSVAVLANSQGIAFVGNRMLGRHAMNNEQRCTPVFKPHTVTLEATPPQASSPSRRRRTQRSRTSSPLTRSASASQSSSIRNSPHRHLVSNGPCNRFK